MRYPCLSFLELQRFRLLLEPALNGARIDRVFVPECLEHPLGFFKNEVVFETRYGQILISLRAQACGIAYLPPKSLRPAKVGTRSGFDLSLSKTLDGVRIESVSTIPGERFLVISFSSQPELKLFLNLLPALPDGSLVTVFDDQSHSLICSSRNRTDFSAPIPRDLSDEVIAKIPNRTDLISSIESYSNLWMQARLEDATALRKQKLLNLLTQQKGSVERKLKSLFQQEELSRNEPDWNYYGTLLQTHFYSKPILKNKHYSLFDYEKNAEVLVPGDEKLNTKQQLEKFFHLAKRSRKRIDESQQRSAALKEKLAAITKQEERLKESSVSFEELKKIELETGFTPAQTDRDTSKKIAGFSGKIYRSQEGLTILSGRSKDENLELTFKIARGNDLWLHVKGRPGSHTVILLPPGKTASLETLLDAANLCLLHSGGKEWGKTEIDYTQRKYVKKIKGQSEVTYSANKTLMITIEEQRLKRLYGENEK